MAGRMKHWISTTLVAGALLVTPSAAHAAQAGIYYASGTKVGAAALDGTGDRTVATAPSTLNGITRAGDALFFGYGGYPSRIGRVGTDGSGLNTDLIPGTTRAWQFAAAGGKLYWTDYGAHTIGRANLDGTGADPSFITLPPGTSPTGIAVAGDHIHWSTGMMADHHIWRAKLDGTAVEATWLDTGAHVGPIASDGTHLFWASAAGLNRARLDGSGVETGFVPGFANGMALTVAGGQVYGPTVTLDRVNTDGTDLRSGFFTPGGFISGVAVVTPPAAAPAAGTVSTTAGKTTAVAIRNTGGASLRVAAATVRGTDAADFAVALGSCATPAPGGGECVLDVAFAPRSSAAGTRSASLEVTFEDGVAPLTIALTGEVPAPAIVAPPVAPPVATTCTSVRSIAFHLPKLRRGQRYTRVDVRFAGKRVKLLRNPKRTFTVSLAGQPKGLAKVLITVTDRSGRSRTKTRSFKTCVPGR